MLSATKKTIRIKLAATAVHFYVTLILQAFIWLDHFVFKVASTLKKFKICDAKNLSVCMCLYVCVRVCVRACVSPSQAIPRKLLKLSSSATVGHDKFYFSPKSSVALILNYVTRASPAIAKFKYHS